MKRLKVWAVGVLLVALGAAGAPVVAQQSNVTNAVVIAALQAMGLFGDGYVTGDFPVWSAPQTRYLPSSSGGVPVVASSFQAAVTPTDCTTAQYGFVGDTDTGIGYNTANSFYLCAGGAARASVNTTSISSTVPIVIPVGTAAATTLNFGTPGTGFYAPNAATNLGIAVAGSQRVSIQTAGVVADSFLLGLSTADTIIVREGANYSLWRNGANAQRASWANTYTSSTNNETFSIDWQTTANVARVGTRTAATGTRRAVQFIAQDSSGADAYRGLFIDPSSSPIMRLGYYNAAMVKQATSPIEFIRLADYTNGATSGTVTQVTIVPDYNQAAATTANTDLLINRTQTSVGSGAQLLIDAQVGGASRFSVSNTGQTTIAANFIVANGQGIFSSSRGGLILGVSADGIAQFTNGGSNGWSRLIFGTNDASGVALNKNGTTLEAKLGDGSAYTTFTAIRGIFAQSALGAANLTLTTEATSDDPAEHVIQGRVATTDATVTTINTITIATSTSTLIECRVVARRTGGASGAAEDGGGWYVWVAVKNTAGTVAEYAAETTTTVGESTAGFNVTTAPSGATLLVQVTGAGTTNITWHSTCRTYGVNQ